MISHRYVDDYVQSYVDGKIKLNKERIELITYLRDKVLSRDDLYFDEVMIDNFVKFTEKWYFPLQPFQKFIICFVFLFYVDTQRIFFRKFLIMMGRGGGKNGLISALVHFFAGPLHGIRKYDVSIVANSELQAKTSFKEIYDTIEAHPTLDQMFYRRKVDITSNHTQSVIQYHTSNASTKDGLRDGCVIFDEIHQYEDNHTVRVFTSGLGKVKNPREFYIGTDGYVREGFLDKMKERAKAIFEGKKENGSLFPFICRLDDAEEVKDISQWEKANPMFCEPRSEYAEELFYIVKEEYLDLEEDPSNREEFMTKRMNFPEEDLEKSVASWDDIMATNRDMPELQHRVAVGGLDFASIKDFAAVGLLFKVGDSYVWKSHSFVRKGFLDRVPLKVPIRQWEDDGLLTVVDEPVIDIKHIVNWFVEARMVYGFQAFIHALWQADNILEDEIDVNEYLDMLDSIDF